MDTNINTATRNLTTKLTWVAARTKLRSALDILRDAGLETGFVLEALRQLPCEREALDHWRADGLSFVSIFSGSIQGVERAFTISTDLDGEMCQEALALYDWVTLGGSHPDAEYVEAFERAKRRCPAFLAPVFTNLHRQLT